MVGYSPCFMPVGGLFSLFYAVGRVSPVLHPMVGLIPSFTPGGGLPPGL